MMTTSELKKTLSFTENLAQKVGEYLLDNQKKVIEEAARKANEEQRKVFFKFRH